ncbi:ribosome-binding protein 1a [Engraulis encrasicolus]|uniref:ribosome-binding protein 1a n=1 Tax=Engraulis encrasicolus TaxID=184585 RepID=UPI002FD1E0A9
MDIYDPQTLGIVVFSGFMVFSAIAIALVSTFSMKETSYEEALAKQRKELGKAGQQPQQQRAAAADKKKKDKARKKKDDKPNGKLPDAEPATSDLSESEGPQTTPVPAAEPEPAPAPAPEPVVVAAAPVVTATPAPAPVAAAPAAPAPAPVAAAPSPKDKKKKEKKVAKVEPAQAQQTSAAPPAPSKPAAAKPAVAKTAEPAVVKEVPVMAVPPVGAQKSSPKPAPAPAAAPAKAEEAKGDAPTKKKGGSKKKTEPAAEKVVVDSVDSPLYLPYKALVSTVKSMMFSEQEAQQLIEVLSEKAGVGTWHTACVKGDPVAVLKKQLEEKERQLATEQQDAAAAKNRVRDLTKEMSAEKSKVASVEAKLNAQLSSREQEMVALQARMQASYQDHVAETHKYKAKIQGLQDQLDKGPSAQMARLQQENSILRDALNQATSQTESKQNAELAKLRQECAKLTKDAGEKSEALQAAEQLRKGLEAKAAAAEGQLAQLQASRASSEQALQRRLEEVSEELRASQSTSSSLQTQLEQTKQDGTSLTDLQARVASAEASLAERGELVEALEARLAQAELEKSQLEDQVGSIHTLLEASQSREEDDGEKQANTDAELEQMKSSLKEKEVQLAALEEQLKQMSTDTITSTAANTTEAAQAPSEELKSLREEVEKKNASNAEMTSEMEQLRVSLQEREMQLASMEAELQQVKEEKASVPNQADNTAELEALQNGLRVQQEQVASLEEELKQAKANADLRPDHTTELASLQSSLSERDALVTSLQQELQRMSAAAEQSKDGDNATAFQSETKEVLHSLFPHIDIQTEETQWLQDFAQKAAETLSQMQQSQETQHSKAELEEVSGKLKAAEEGQVTLQAECEQYRTVLAETEGMLKHLQRSVEEEERGWKTKVAELQEQLKTANEKVQSMEQLADSQNTDQLREQVMLLEAQLEKQLESATSDSNTYSEEMNQLKLLLAETQGQLEGAHREAEAQREELGLVREQLGEMTEHAQREDQTTGPQNGQSEPEVQAKLSSTAGQLEEEEGLRQHLTDEYLQAQRTVTELQAQLDLLKGAGDAETEDVAELKERLEKEKKLSKDLGQAATKLQQLLKASHDQLAKEKDAVKVLRDQLLAKDETGEVKEGTSV